MSVPDEVKDDNRKVTISDILFRGQSVTGCYGVEIEVEGLNLPTELSASWSITRDGSLRGEAYEYVFAFPLDRANARKALASFYKKMSTARWDDTGRAGVHVHMNVRDLDIKEMLSFICLYLVFEEVLLDFCGEDRKGNLFCLQSDDAEFFMIKLKDFLESLSFNTFATDTLRYSSLNLTALKKYGSLEFRSLPSPVSEDRLNLWIDLLTMIRNKAVAYADPRLIVAGVSEYGGEDFARAILEDLFTQLPCENWNKAVFKGMRKIQPLMVYFNHEEILRYEKEVRSYNVRKAATSDGIPTFFNIPNGITVRTGVPVGIRVEDWAMVDAEGVPQPIPAFRGATERIAWGGENPFPGAFEAFVLGEER